MFKELRRLVRAKEIILYLIVQQLKSSHRDKLLGNIWSLLNPLSMMLVFYFVFHTVRQAPISFMLYFLSGILAWESFSVPMRGTSLALKRRKDLIQKFPVPLGVFPAAIVLQRIYDFLWGFLAYLVIYLALRLFADHSLSFSLAGVALLPIWVFFYLTFTLGVSFIVARLGVLFADMDDITGIILQAGYFLNPVFLDMSYIPAKYHKLYLLLNPLAGFMVCFRHLMPGANQHAHYLIPIPYYPYYLVGVSLAVFFLGFAFFQHGSKHYAKYL